MIGNFSEYKNITFSQKLCSNPCLLFKNILNSTIEYIKFRSVIDIVPSIIKCKKYFRMLYDKGFIIKSNYSDSFYQYFEVNKVIYSKYILFKRIYVERFRKFYKKEIINISNSIGIHFRQYDTCFDKLCELNYIAIKRLHRKFKILMNNNQSVIFLSTVNERIDKILLSGYKYIKYMPTVKPIHISKINRTITTDEISKTIGDILLIASAKYLVLSKGSTFSYLILSIGGLDDKGRIKKFSIYDIDGYEKNKYNVDLFTFCTKAVICSI